MIRTLLPTLAVLALTGAIYQEIARSDLEPPAPPASRSAALNVASLNEGGPDTVIRNDGRLTEILARPLFSPDRRPIESARGVAGLSRLSGIVVAGTRRLAIFAGAAGGRAVIAEEGARIGRYEVRSITDTGVTVVGPDGAAVTRPVFDPTGGKPGVALLSRGPTK